MYPCVCVCVHCARVERERRSETHRVIYTRGSRHWSSERAAIAERCKLRCSSGAGTHSRTHRRRVVDSVPAAAAPCIQTVLTIVLTCACVCVCV